LGSFCIFGREIHGKRKVTLSGLQGGVFFRFLHHSSVRGRSLVTDSGPSNRDADPTKSHTKNIYTAPNLQPQFGLFPFAFEGGQSKPLGFIWPQSAID
jgi:hypothetical protein